MWKRQKGTHRVGAVLNGLDEHGSLRSDLYCPPVGRHDLRLRCQLIAAHCNIGLISNQASEPKLRLCCHASPPHCTQTSVSKLENPEHPCFCRSLIPAPHEQPLILESLQLHHRALQL